VAAWAATLLVLAGCAVLAWAGLEKIRDRAPLAATVTALGVPARWAPGLAIAVPVAELGAVLGVVLGAPAWVSAAWFAVLGVAFAAAGVRAATMDRTIACACFGNSERRLGSAQVVTLPLWLVAGWACTALPASTLDTRIEIFAAGMLVLAVARAVPALRRGVAARADRRAVVGAVVGEER
jgi:hypothetical protein